MDMHGQRQGEKQGNPFATGAAAQARGMTAPENRPDKHGAHGSGTDKPEPQDRTGRDRPTDPISRGLRKLWQDVALEPVPDDFLSLLDKIQSGASRPAGSTIDGSTTPEGKKRR